MGRKNLTTSAVVVVLACLSIVSAYLIATGQGTLPPCTNPPYATTAGQPDPVHYSWPQGTPVTVIIDQNFSPQQQDAVRQGFNNWLNPYHGVTFSFQVGAVPNTITQPPSNTVYVLAIR